MATVGVDPLWMDFIMTPSPADSSAGPSKRPSLRSVAEAAGVSAMTVSRVLRNYPAISESVRARVQKAVRSLGYLPDPEMAKLMHHLRKRRKPAFQASICALTTRGPDAPPSTYCDGIELGAEQRAEALGYSFSTLQIGPSRETWRTLPRILRSRGVEGVVLLPMLTPAKFDGLLDWRDFSIVSTTSSVLSPALHAVLPHHFKNSQMLAERLFALGYRRIGVVINFEQTQRLSHALTAAVTWHGLLHEGRCVPPLIYSGRSPLGLEEWFQREQPDVIVTHIQRLCREFAERLGLSLPGPVGVVSANTEPGAPCAGINECPEDIGCTAIDLLAGMIQRGVRGIPEMPTTTQVPGFWVNARSCPKRRTTPPKAAPPTGTPAVYLER